MAPGDGAMVGLDAKTDRTARDAHATTAIAVLFGLWALERIFAMTFVLNFSDQGPGPSVLLLMLSANGLVYATPLARNWPHNRQVLDLSLAVLVVATVAAHALPPAGSLFFALVALAAVTPLIATVMARQGRNVVFGIALGTLLHIAARAWNANLPLDATPGGRTIGLSLVLGAVAVWVFHERNLFAHVPGPVQSPRLALIMTLLVLEAALLIHPAGIARWAGVAVWPITIASAAGLAVGAAANILPPLPPWLRWTPVLLLTGGITWITFGSGQVAATFVAQAGAIRLVARANGVAPVGRIRHIGLRTGLVQLGAILIVFLHATAPSWAFLPGPLPLLTRNLAAFWLFVLAGFTAIVATPGLIADDTEVPA